MSISLAVIQDLRSRTGSGIKDCKEALVECGGDIEKAVEYLRKKGLATAEKKGSRATDQGRIFAQLSADSTQGVLLELNCETDFVANTDDFQGLGTALCEHILAQKPQCVTATASADGPALLEQAFYKDQSKKVDTVIKETIGKLKENINVRRFACLEGSRIAYYIHTGGKIAVLLQVDAEELEATAVDELLKDICMQICAMTPLAISRDDLAEEVIAKEKEIYVVQAQEQAKNKPEHVRDKIVQSIIKGRLEKFYKETVLLEQSFIKDETKTVAQYLKESPGGITLKKFVRFVVGG